MGGSTDTTEPDTVVSSEETKVNGHKKYHFKIGKTFSLTIMKDQNKLSMAVVESPPPL